MAIYSNAEPTPEQMEKITKAVEVCKPQTGATDADISSLMKHEMPETKTGQCFVACMNKQCGIVSNHSPINNTTINMSADNKIDVAKIKEMAAPLKEKDAEKYEKGMKMVETCAAEANSEADECDVAKKMMECCKKEAAAMGISFKEFVKH
ncbi:hypothetical protein CBL_01064 [Carabus blaptoides fortunei]